MFTKDDATSRSEVLPQTFFSSASTTNASSWQMIYSGWSRSIFVNYTSKTLIGLGEEYTDSNSPKKKPWATPWTIPLRDELGIKQIAAGDYHILILYDNGLLEGYGNGWFGGLGIGDFRDRDLITTAIQLPNGETPITIGVAERSSIVISDKGTLYGFGSNDSGQLGLGNKLRHVDFPTPIPLPAGVIPEHIYMGNEKTIIACKGGELFGFGNNVSGQLGFLSSVDDYSQTTPKRLLEFEALKPRSFALGKNCVIVLSTEGNCFFNGINSDCHFPVDYNHKSKKITLPENFRPILISCTHNHLLLLSEQGDVWGLGQDYGYYKPVKIEAPGLDKAQSFMAGVYTSFILSPENNCYILGDVEPLNLTKKTPTPPLCLSMRQLAWDINRKTISSKPISIKPSLLESLFMEQVLSGNFQDNTEIILALEKDEGSVIEFNRPSGFGKSVTLSMLHAFYSNTCNPKQDYFQNMKISHETGKHVSKKSQFPSLILDLSELDYRDIYTCRDSYNQLIAALYCKFRVVLFHGVLRDKKDEKEQYQRVALQKRSFWENTDNSLITLTQYLRLQYGQKVKLFIDNADFHLRCGLQPDVLTPIEVFLKERINPALGGSNYQIGNPYVGQTILTGILPSPFDFNEQPIKKIYGSIEREVRYNPYFGVRQKQELNKEKQRPHLPDDHFIHALRVKPLDCAQIGQLLEGNTIETVFTPNKPFKCEEDDIFNCLTQAGLLTASYKDKASSILSIQLANETAKTIVSELYKKWSIQNMNRVTVVFDIDNLLATHDKCSRESILFFLRKGTIINAYGVTHYILPGVLELMRFLFSLPEVRVAFFSSGARIRNEPFVKILLTKALGEEHYNRIAADVVIMSEGNLMRFDSSKYSTQNKQYGLYKDHNDHTKDINFTLAPEDSLKNAIFIDDRPAFIHYEQEKNYVYAETVKSKDFDCLNNSELGSYNPENLLFRKVNFVFYLACILNNCIKFKNEEPITDKLFAMHFVPSQQLDEEKPSYKPVWGKSMMDLTLYQEGLNILQQFNPALTLTTPDTYKECVTPVPSKIQEEEIVDAKEHESNESKCVLM